MIDILYTVTPAAGDNDTSIATTAFVQSIISPQVVTASPTGNQNDYAITGVELYRETTLILTPTVSMKLTGISTTGWVAGKKLTIFNGTDPNGSGARLIILERASASSASVNRFNFPKGLIPYMIMPGEAVILQWNGTNFDLITSTRPFTIRGYFDLGYYNAIGGDNWSLNNGGTGISSGGNYGYTEGISGQPMTAREIGTGTTSGGDIRQVASSDSGVAFGAGAMLFFACINSPILSTVTDEFKINAGFFDGTPIVDGAGWRYDRLGKGVNWQTWNISNSVETINDSGVAVTAGRFMRLGTFVNGDASRIDYFYSNDEGATWSFATASTTNIPTGAARATGVGCGIVKSAGTNARVLALHSFGYRRMNYIT